MIWIVLLFCLIPQSSSLTSSSRDYTTNTSNQVLKNNMIPSTNNQLITISETVWRNAASCHRKRIYQLLKPGLTSHPTERRKRNNHKTTTSFGKDEWTSLDPKNPIYNFLIEYYSLKGAKGPRKLGRWSPNPSLLLQQQQQQQQHNQEMQQLEDPIYHAIMKASKGLGGIFLQNANQNDIGSTLHLKGCIPVLSTTTTTGNQEEDCNLYGILYNPALFYNRQPYHLLQHEQERQKVSKAIAPFQWYSSILRTTLQSEPILHCHGLHEWAMQYHPMGAPPPPSAKYQSSLPLRVSREIINQTVERKGISCTHVDALRFFAPAAGPLNHHGSQLVRTDQLRLEQKACVHAHMDLLKIALKIQPFLDSTLLSDVLEVAIKARTLDVEASPYDATHYGAGIVPVETKEGRKLYRDRQMALMEEVEPIRVRLLHAYEDFMELAFEKEFHIHPPNNNNTNPQSSVYVAPERYAKAEPGGLPWRRNLIEK